MTNGLLRGLQLQTRCKKNGAPKPVIVLMNGGVQERRGRREGTECESTFLVPGREYNLDARRGS